MASDKIKTHLSANWETKDAFDDHFPVVNAAGMVVLCTEDYGRPGMSWTLWATARVRGQTLDEDDRQSTFLGGRVSKPDTNFAMVLI